MCHSWVQFVCDESFDFETSCKQSLRIVIQCRSADFYSFTQHQFNFIELNVEKGTDKLGIDQSSSGREPDAELGGRGEHVES